ncbi:MAG: DNA polymerase I [Coriobacteriales bacterium]|jgi:DNA polymerase-1|nr:DNA polymerase I [Coriobacteriales bacterium]
MQSSCLSKADRPLRTLAVIDGNSLLHRAFHAIQSSMKAPDGRPTNACFGFLSMLFKLITDFSPQGIICTFDDGIPEFRFRAIKLYKAQRPPTDPLLAVQFGMIEKLLVAMGIPVVRKQGWEGDDILGTLSARAETEGGIRMLLITGDKDALQLASATTTIVTNRTGMSEVCIYDPAGVEERFGVAPRYVPDFLGLMGDSSDNIPGVPGVGPKTAKNLLEHYHDLEGVIAHASEIKGKLGQRIAASAQVALDSREAATIARDVPLDFNLDTVVFPAYSEQTVKRAFAELAMNTQLRKFLSLTATTNHGSQNTGTAQGADIAQGTSYTSGTAQSVLSAVAADIVPDKGALQVSQSPALEPAVRDAAPRLAQTLSQQLAGQAAQAALDEALEQGQQLALYLEGTDSLSGFQKGQQSLDFDHKDHHQLYIATPQSILVLSTEAAAAALLKILVTEKDAVLSRQTQTTTLPPTSPRVPAAIDAKSVLRALVPQLRTRQADLAGERLLDVRLFDVGVANYLLDSDNAQNSPYALLSKFLPHLDPAEFEPVEPGAFVAALTLLLKDILVNRLVADASMRCFAELEVPLLPVLVSMERNGVKVATDVLALQGAKMTTTINALKAEAYTEANEEFNLDSPRQISEILFDRLKLPPGKKTQRGYSTNAGVLADLAPLNPLPGIILRYRELAKLSSTYLETLPRLVAADGLIHTSFNQTVAATGRLSSSDPNLQNIPVRSDLGREIRTAFVADAQTLGVEKAVFVSADYSQIELRLLAHLSGDEHLIRAFIEGEDFHAETAARVFGIPLNQVTPELRSRAKAVNFGIVYGQQAYGLSQSLHISYEEAQEMIDRYFHAYPQVKEYMECLKHQALTDGYVETIFGRKRRIREINSSNSNRRANAERMAMNHPMQGSAADIIKLAMIEVSWRLAADGYRSQLVLQVHDELDFNCDATELQQLSLMAKTVMSGVVKLKVPLIAEVSSGSNWAEAH